MSIDRIAIVGTGRVGLSLARALVHSGQSVAMLGRRATPMPHPLDPPLLDWNVAIANAELVIIAVPDDEISNVANRLAAEGSITSSHVALHTSGLHDRSTLASLSATGAALGSWHPLQTFASPSGEPAALAGSPAVIEGDPEAIVVGRELAALLHLRPVIEIDPAKKPLYHAGAVFASNYLIVLADIAARMAGQAGAGDASAELYLPLMRRTLSNYLLNGARSLTGPIARGDAGTVRQHLQALDGRERELYRLLGGEALKMAAGSGLDPAKVQAIEALLSA